MIFYTIALFALVWAIVVAAIAVHINDLLTMALGFLAVAGSAAVLHFGEASQ